MSGVPPSRSTWTITIDPKTTFEELRKYINDMYFLADHFIHCQFIFKTHILPAKFTIQHIINEGFDLEKEALMIQAVGERFDLRREPEIPDNPSDAKYISALAKDLEMGTTGYREEAAIRLGNSGNKLAAGPLISALNDEYPVLRFLAAEVLGKLRDPQSVEPLLHLLDDRNPDVCRAAIRALEQIGDAHVCSLLVQKLCDKHFIIKQAAKAALVQLGWKPASPSEQILAMIVQEKFEPTILPGDQELNALKTSFREGDSETRAVIVKFIDAYHYSLAIDILQEASNDRNIGVRDLAQKALEKM